MGGSPSCQISICKTLKALFQLAPEKGTKQIHEIKKYFPEMGKKAFRNVRCRVRGESRNLITPWTIKKIFLTILLNLAKKYNKCHEAPLPKMFSAHVLRHTFCTNLANAGINPKALQYIMGHANITMTLNYYAHASFDSARAEMKRLTA